MIIKCRLRLRRVDDSSVEVRRCMRVRSCDGREVGFVAAVMIDELKQEATHVLLGRLPVTPIYRLIPIHLIDQIDEETVHLNIQSNAVEELSIHQPD
ncbi:MAG: hypothetical protein ACE5E7_15665 [Anaerolineae bacterium]